MTLIRRILTPRRLLREQQGLINDQARLIHDQQNELRRNHLEHAREMQGIVCAWLLSSEMPEVDLRPDLAELDRTLGNRVAQLEEHVL